MKHLKSSFYFKDKENEWGVEYVYYHSKWGDDSMKSVVYLNGELYWDFVDGIPNTRTEHPTKSQAKEVIAIAKREYKAKYKVRDDRDKKLNTLLDS